MVNFQAQELRELLTGYFRQGEYVGLLRIWSCRHSLSLWFDYGYVTLALVHVADSSSPLLGCIFDKRSMLRAKALNSATDKDGFSKVFELMKKSFDSREEYERIVAELRSELSKDSPIVNFITIEEENGNILSYVMYCFGFSSYLGKKRMVLELIYVVDDNEETLLQALNKLRSKVHQVAAEHNCSKISWCSTKDSKFSSDPNVIDTTSLEGCRLYKLKDCAFHRLLDM